MVISRESAQDARILTDSNQNSSLNIYKGIVQTPTNNDVCFSIFLIMSTYPFLVGQLVESELHSMDWDDQWGFEITTIWLLRREEKRYPAQEARIKNWITMQRFMINSSLPATNV